MSRFAVPFMTLPFVFLASQAWAQKPETKSLREARNISSMQVEATPEMWFYEEQLRRYENPRVAVRRNAEIRAEQRRERIASMKWYGYSNLRPRANPTPWGASYSPQWSSNSADSFSWVGPVKAVVVPRPTQPTFVR